MGRVPTGTSSTQVRPGVTRTGAPLASVNGSGAVSDARYHVPFTISPGAEIPGRPPAHELAVGYRSRRNALSGRHRPR